MRTLLCCLFFGPCTYLALSPGLTVRSQLREIEIIIGARLEIAEVPAEEGAVPVVTEDEKETLLQMQQILYSTEVRFPRVQPTSPGNQQVRAPVPQGSIGVPIACSPGPINVQEGFEVPQEAEEGDLVAAEEETF